MPGRIEITSPPPSASHSSSSPPPSSSPRADPTALAHAHRRQRPPSPTRAHQTLVRNRRLRYLEQHTTYFTSADLELADPLLYDRLIRQFLTPDEREAQGRERGWSGVLEADLTRAEAKVAAVADADADTEARAENERGEQVGSKEEGEEMWRKAMTLRFLGGGDEEADYERIDNDEEYDDYTTVTREEEEKYFDAETPSSSTENGDTGVLDY